MKSSVPHQTLSPSRVHKQMYNISSKQDLSKVKSQLKSSVHLLFYMNQLRFLFSIHQDKPLLQIRAQCLYLNSTTTRFPHNITAISFHLAAIIHFKTKFLQQHHIRIPSYVLLLQSNSPSSTQPLIRDCGRPLSTAWHRRQPAVGLPPSFLLKTITHRSYFSSS